MESINENEYQKEWHNSNFLELTGFMEAKETLLSISLYALTQFLITKELYQLNQKGEE
jgi:hypothetical protein